MVHETPLKNGDPAGQESRFLSKEGTWYIKFDAFSILLFLLLVEVSFGTQLFLAVSKVNSDEHSSHWLVWKLKKRGSSQAIHYFPLENGLSWGQPITFLVLSEGILGGLPT